MTKTKKMSKEFDEFMNGIGKEDEPKTKNMSKEDKYYQPEIEEFHVGFEYYMPLLKEDEEGNLYQDKYILHIWTEKCSMENYFNVDYIDNSTTKIISVPDILKVKLLDREDIESLGWVKDSGDCDYINDKDNQLEIYPTLYSKGLCLPMSEPSFSKLENYLTSGSAGNC